MSNAKRQHWIPKFYLKEFAIPETRDLKHPQVWVFSKDQGDKDAFQIGIENVALENFLYSPVKQDGTRDFSVEEDLSELESLIARGWNRIANEFVDFRRDAPTRKIVALFMATLILRHPQQLEKTKQINQQLRELAHTVRKNAEGNRIITLTSQDGESKTLDISDWNTSTDLNESEMKELFASNIRAIGGEIAHDLLKKRWSVVYSKNPIFCTSDNPVIMANPTESSFGIMTKGTKILFPLSPTRFLILDDHLQVQDGSYYAAKPGAQEHFCGMVWFLTHKFLIAHGDPLEFLRGVVALRDKEQAIINAMWPLNRQRTKRNERCPCGSGLKWKRCCGTIS